MSSSNESVRLSAFPSAGLCSFLYINRLSGRALGMKYVTPPSSSVWSPFWSIHQDPLLCSARLPRVWPPSLCWCFECSPTLFCVPFEHFMPYRFLVVVVARPAATTTMHCRPKRSRKGVIFFIARDLFGFFFFLLPSLEYTIIIAVSVTRSSLIVVVPDHTYRFFFSLSQIRSNVCVCVCTFVHTINIDTFWLVPVTPRAWTSESM